MTQKKDVLDALIMHEINKCDEMCNVFEKLKIVEMPPKGYISESQLYCWIESDPTKAEKKKVLTALGYDVSKL